MIAQELTLLCPQVVRRLVLVGTGPQRGQLMHGWISDVAALANVAKNHPEDLLALFFEITPTSQQKGREFLQRCAARHDDRDVPASLQARDARRLPQHRHPPRPERHGSARAHHPDHGCHTLAKR
jgi:pimeloyl-ACP methyl ester carboxylesterase